MRFHSTPESVQKGEVTQLAIIECVGAVAIYIAIGVYFNTFRLLAAAVAVAPLTLLRTEASTRWGLKKYEEFTSLGEHIDFKESSWGALLPFFFVPVVALAGVVIRMIATLYWALRNPLDTLREMPQNWLRQAFCTDLFYPPEVVPLEAVYRDGQLITFMGLWGVLRGSFQQRGDERREWHKVLAVLAPFAVIGFLPALFYRVSFKATSVAYAPFVWVAHATLRTPESIKLRLERITKGELEKTRRWVSGLVALALLTKIALVLKWIGVAAAPAWLPKTLLESTVWPWWLVTLGVDAFMTFCLLWYADAALARLEGKGVWREETVTRTVSAASFLRASMGIITMSHFFYVALVTVAAGHGKSPAL